MPRAFSSACCPGHLALHHRTERHVLQVGLPREQRAVLEHHHAVGPGLGLGLVRPAQHVAVEIDRAAGDVVEAGDGVEQRGLAAARGPDDHADLAGADVEAAVGRPPAPRPRARGRPCPRSGCGSRPWWRIPARTFIAPPQRELAHAPLHQVVAREAHQRAARIADDADRDHADDDHHVLDVDVRGDDQVAEPVFARHHLRRHQREPGHADRDLQPGEDERQRAGDDDVAEDLPLARAQAGGRARIRLVDRLHAEHGVERRGVERGERGEEDHRRLVALEHDDRERHPGEHRDRSQRLEHREGEFAEVPSTSRGTGRTARRGRWR